MSDNSFKMDPHPTMTKSDMTADEVFTTASKEETNHSHFESKDDKISVGTWECDPSREEFESYPVHEMMTLISGKLTLTHKDGREEHLGAGDTFYIAKGQHVVWEITEQLRKFYMIVE
jgi:uncharacterized cupin superfamily protein